MAKTEKTETVEATKVPKKRMEKFEKQVVPVDNAEFEKLVEALESKSISVQCLADNLKVASATASLWNAPIPMTMYDPSKANRYALVALLKFADVDIDSFSIDNWEIATRRQATDAPVYAIGEYYKLPENSGKQSALCEYVIAWTNDDYVLFVPIKNQATDEAGFILDSPRCMSRTASKALRPERIAE